MAAVKSALLEVVRVSWGFLSSHYRGIGLHLEMRRETQGSSRVASGTSSLLLSFNWEVWPHLVWRHGTPLSSRVVYWVSGILSSSGRKHMCSVEVQQGR